MSENIVPTSIEEVSVCLRDFHAAHQQLSIRGGGTHGARVSPERTILSLIQYTGVVKYSPDDLTITVKAGTTLHELQRTLAEHRQWLPIDIAANEMSTIGGVVAAGLQNNSWLRYGSLRDYIIAARYVMPGGDIAKSGSNVVKSVAGYDVHKLLCGSRGTLCVIAELTFKIAPLPETRFILHTPWNAQSAQALREYVKRGVPAIAKVCSPALARRMDIGNAPTLVMRIDGYREDVRVAVSMFDATATSLRETDPSWNGITHELNDWNLGKMNSVAVSGNSSDLERLFLRTADSDDSMYDPCCGSLVIDDAERFAAAPDVLQSPWLAQYLYRLERVPWAPQLPTPERQLALRLKSAFDAHEILDRWDIYD